MDTQWVKIFATDSPIEAEMVTALLSEHGIEAVNLSKKDSTYLVGELEIYVHRNQVVLAKHILEENKN